MNAMLCVELQEKGKSLDGQTRSQKQKVQMILVWMAGKVFPIITENGFYSYRFAY